MRTSDKGRRFIALEEGERFVGYADSRGIPTIGVGHTGPVRGAPLVVGQTTITKAESDALLVSDLATAEHAVNEALKLRPSMPQSTFDALVSFAFNVGAGGFEKSDVRKQLVLGADLRLVAGCLFGWTRAGSNLVELVERRAREGMIIARGIYLTPDSRGNWIELKT